MTTAARKIIFHFCFAGLLVGCAGKRNAVVFQTDFGLKDGAVSEMKGITYGVDAGLQLYDITHEIPAYNVWDAAYRLYQTVPYWPAGTVFVSVVDPGVGTARRSIVAKIRSGQYIVTPDNGTLTLIADAYGIETIRLIDESKNRRQGSAASYTFYGRDVYAYTAARLASGKINFKGVGPLTNDPLVRLPYQQPQLVESSISGTIPVLDMQYGNIWTNINDTLFKQLQVHFGEKINFKIKQNDSLVFQGAAPYAKTFGDVPEGRALVYLNSLMNVSIAINKGNFADSFAIGSGNDWSIQIQKSMTH